MNVATVHIDAVALRAPLFVHHDDGDISVQLTQTPVLVWLHGTPAELRAFAATLTETVADTNPQMAPEAVAV